MAELGKLELVYEYLDAESQPIRCDLTNCRIGSFLIEQAGLKTYIAACPTCKFAGDLDTVFNPAEPRHTPGAPEDFKIAAARILTAGSAPSINVIRPTRPETAVMIDEYAAVEASA